METMDDAELVKRSQSGDRDAIGILYNTYLGPMRDVVERYVHNHEAADDILHDGFIIAITSIGSLRNGASLGAWLTTIMRNLSLQHIKDTANRVAVSDALIPTPGETDEHDRHADMSWEELERIIDRLPEGYGKVFRLAVLDGMSHKEIGAMLGIAPHSSSSQLTHAKAMLRRLISQYRAEMGILSTAAIAILLWNIISRHHDQVIPVTAPTAPLTPPAAGYHTPPVSGELIPADNLTEELPASSPRNLCLTPDEDVIREEIAATTVLPAGDSLTPAPHDSDTPHPDTTRLRLGADISPLEHLAQADIRPASAPSNSGWSITLTYTNPINISTANGADILSERPMGPDTDADTRQEIHHMPVVAGMSVSKRLTGRWSIESGIRYTYLRTDSKSKYDKTSQRIHYIGVPLQMNYRIISIGGCSLYGQGGAEIDIPIKATHSVAENQPGNSIPTVKNTRINPPVQWSARGGIGIQYNLSPKFSIYAEPSVVYYFNSGSDMQTLHQRGPVGFNLPIGLRMTW